MARGFEEDRPYRCTHVKGTDRGAFVSDPLRFSDSSTGWLPAGTCYFDAFLRAPFVRLGLDGAVVRP